MALAVFNEFNQTIDDIADGKHNLSTDAFKFLLTNVAPVATNSVKTDLTEIAAGNGYTAGGVALTIASSSQTNGSYAWVGGNSPVVTASGGAIAQFRYLALYNDTSVGKSLIGWYDYGVAIDLADGESLTINADGVTIISGSLTAV